MKLCSELENVYDRWLHVAQISERCLNAAAQTIRPTINTSFQRPRHGNLTSRGFIADETQRRRTQQV